MANINRVVLVGNLTKDPELRHTPSGTAVCKLRLAVNTRQKDAPTGEWGDKPNYFDVTVWGNQGESCAQYLSKGRPVGVDGRLDWREWDAQDGTKRQAVEIIADTVQFLGSRGDARGRRRSRQFVPRRRDRATTPTSAGGRHRRRHPVLDGTQRRQRQKERQGERRRAPTAAPGRRRNCYFCKDKIDEVDYKNINQLRRYVSEKGKIRSRRITGACRRHQRQVAVAVKRAREMALLPYVGELSAMEVILRQDVEKLGLRGEVVDVARGYARNFLLPRKLAEPATPARVAELEKATRTARGTRRRASSRRRRSRSGSGRPSSASTSRPATTGVALRLGDARPTSPTRSGRSTKIRVDRRKIELAEPIKRIGRYQVPIELFADVTAEVRDARRARGRRAAARGGARGDRGGRGSRRRGRGEPPRRPRSRRPSRGRGQRPRSRQPSSSRNRSRSSQSRGGVATEDARRPGRSSPTRAAGVTRASLICPQARARAVDKFTKNPLTARNSARPLFGDLGTMSDRLWTIVRTCVPSCLQTAAFRSCARLRTRVVHTVEIDASSHH